MYYNHKKLRPPSVAKRAVRFAKMHTLGNDFMVIDGVTQKILPFMAHIQQWSDRHCGVGFDQLLLIEPPYDPEVDFHYRIFNADGSEVGQCGNGACCLARFIYQQKLSKRSELLLTTQHSRLLLKHDHGEEIQVTLEAPCFIPACIPFYAETAQKNYTLVIDARTITCGVVSVGNPHCVIQVEDCATAPVEQLGALLTNYTRFPQQTNVGFMQIINPHTIRLRVYERGVGETRACGSGACAAVAIGVYQGVLCSEVEVTLPGGVLKVRWQGPGHPLFLIGSAHYVYAGIIEC